MANPDKKAKDVIVACYGIAFKPDIDDLRESPALDITKEIISKHAGRVMIVEPNIETCPKALEGGELIRLEAAQAQADIHVLLVPHQEFKSSQAPKSGIVDVTGTWVKV